MNQFLARLGRFGHFAIQAGLLAAQGYAAYQNGGKVGAVNYALAVAQVYAADQARMAPVPPPEAPAQPKEK